MPGPTDLLSTTTTQGASGTRSRGRNRNRTLILIDAAPLQRAAWAEFHAARKRHDKAARDLHRHEQVDAPAFDAWLHRTFPVFITSLRELHQEVFTKGRQVEAVQAMASLTGRSPKKLWREQKAYEADPEAFGRQFEGSDFEGSSSENEERDRTTEDDFFRNDDRSAGQGFQSGFERDFNSPSASSTPEAKSIYRRLVQHLHPDRGGEFTAVRQRLWHEVQQAWSMRDVDWLSRIEVEWETANEVLGPTSPLSRLRRAIEELHGARRDTERKLREYRSSSRWRFTLTESKRANLHRRIETNFKHDLEFLQRQLAYLNATIAAWEAVRPRGSRHRNTTW